MSRFPPDDTDSHVLRNAALVWSTIVVLAACSIGTAVNVTILIRIIGEIAR
jgi:hypothetical protein